MKTRHISIIAASAVLMVFAIAQPSIAVRANSSFAGTWEAKINDLPGITLTIDERGGKVSGIIVFYFQERADPNSPWHIAGESRSSLLAPHVQGQTLTFEAQHHKCHDCPELGPNVKFRMELAGPNEARLWKLDDQETGKTLGPGLKLVRQSNSAPRHEHSPSAMTAPRHHPARIWS